jgi:hypothetical protein
VKRFAAVACLVLSASSARAQTSVADQLARAIDAYRTSRVEEAKAAFASIIASRQQVTNEQRVTAYKYLGAYWALQSSPGARDSATSFFLAAIDLDPFVELDRNIFAADEQQAFALAKRATPKIGIAPIEPKALDPSNPDSARYVFRVVSTRTARLTATIVKLNDPANTQEVIATIGQGEGVRDIPWNGLINNARADSGLYEFRLEAEDAARAGTTTRERQRFLVQHVTARLEDTLPAFVAADTLRSEHSSARPYGEGARGAFIAVVAGAVPLVVLSQKKNMSQWGSHLGVGIALGVVGGIGGYTYASKNPKDARADAENARRRDARAKFNAEVMARNRARLDRTILVIRPLTAGLGG